MRSIAKRAGARTVFVAAALAAVAACAIVALTSPLGHDYPGPTCVGCDFPGPSIAALAHGDLHGFFANQPMMGIVSLLLRVPAVAIAGSTSELTLYRAGVFACLLATAAVALWVALRGLPRDQGPLARCAFLLAVVAGPVSLKAIMWGHPEEILAGTLCVAAVLLAGRSRVTAAGIALGVAVATKQWALLALGPALVCAPRDRRRLVVSSLAVAAVLTLPMLLGDAHRFIGQNRSIGAGGTWVSPSSVWWPFGSLTGVQISNAAQMVGVYKTIPHWLGAVTHPLVLGLGAGIAVLYARSRAGRERDAGGALGLLAVILLIRTAFDPLSMSYHHTPFFIALVAWEGVRRRGVPVASLLVTGLMYSTNQVTVLAGPDALNRYYLAWALPLIGLLALLTFRPDLPLPRLLGAGQSSRYERQSSAM